MWLGWALLGIRLLNLLFILFDGDEYYHLYPFAPASGPNEVLQTWQSWVFLTANHITIAFFIGVPIFVKIDAFKKHILSVFFCVECLDIVEELLTGGSPYIGDVVSFNTISFCFLFIFMCKLQEWKSSQ